MAQVTYICVSFSSCVEDQLWTAVLCLGLALRYLYRDTSWVVLRNNRIDIRLEIPYCVSCKFETASEGFEQTDDTSVNLQLEH